MKRVIKYQLTINLSHNDVKCGFEMLHEILLAREKYRVNQILCNINFMIPRIGHHYEESTGILSVLKRQISHNDNMC